MPSLRACFDKHGCDRGKRHGYERVYEPLFAPIRLEPLRILEIGIFEGAGIAAWLEYFPWAQVFGIDTFQRVPPEEVSVLKHERVTWQRVDSTDHSTRHALAADCFDIIFDDGDHHAEAQLATWHNYHTVLARRGMYFIEDVWPGKPGYPELLAALPPWTIHHKLKGAVDSYIIQC